MTDTATEEKKIESPAEEKKIEDPEVKSKFRFEDREVEIDPLKFPAGKMRQLCEVVAKYRASKSIVTRYPRKIDEDKEKYEARLLVAQKHEQIYPFEGESEIDYQVRVFGPNMGWLELGLQVVNKMLELQGDAPLSREQFESRLAPDIQKFLFDTLMRTKTYIEEFDYKRFERTDEST